MLSSHITLTDLKKAQDPWPKLPKFCEMFALPPLRSLQLQLTASCIFGVSSVCTQSTRSCNVQTRYNHKTKSYVCSVQTSHHPIIIWSLRQEYIWMFEGSLLYRLPSTTVPKSLWSKKRRPNYIFIFHEFMRSYHWFALFFGLQVFQPSFKMTPNIPEKFTLSSPPPRPYHLQTGSLPSGHTTSLPIPLARDPKDQRRRLLEILHKALDLTDDFHTGDAS